MAGSYGETAPLRVGAALPDPPFEFMTPAGPAGFDIALMQRIAAQLGREWQLVRYTGADFNGIFAGLDDGRYDCIASGATITPDRERVAEFCAPYAVSGQSLVVDPARHPTVRGVADLKGLVIGVQQGNTSQPVADRLVAEQRAARVRVYAYDEIEQALDDLSAGGCDAFMKLAPVTAWFVRNRPRLEIVQTGITREVILYARSFVTNDERARTRTDGSGGFRFVGNASHALQLHAEAPGLGRSARVTVRLLFRGEDAVLREPLRFGVSG